MRGEETGREQGITKSPTVSSLKARIGTEAVRLQSPHVDLEHKMKLELKGKVESWNARGMIL